MVDMAEGRIRARALVGAPSPKTEPCGLGFGLACALLG
jgi:hypothetical protein